MLIKPWLETCFKRGGGGPAPTPKFTFITTHNGSITFTTFQQENGQYLATWTGGVSGSNTANSGVGTTINNNGSPTTVVVTPVTTGDSFKEVNCDNCGIISYTLLGNNPLQTFFMVGNPLTGVNIDLKPFTASLVTADLSGCDIASIDITGCTMLTNLQISGGFKSPPINLTGGIIGLSTAINLQNLSASTTAYAGTFDISNLAGLLYCDLSDNINLQGITLGVKNEVMVTFDANNCNTLASNMNVQYLVGTGTACSASIALCNQSGSPAFSGELNTLNASGNSYTGATMNGYKGSNYASSSTPSTTDFSNNLMNAVNINLLFTSLGTAYPYNAISVAGNPGAATCTPTIATVKGWIVST